MFWKNNSVANFSLENRLITLFTSATTFMLFITGIFFYIILVHLINQGSEQFLIDESIIIRGIFARPSNLLIELKQEVNGVPASLKNASYTYFMRLKKVDGSILLETPNFDKALDKAVFPAFDAAKSHSPIIKWVSPSKKIYYLMTAPVQFDTKHTPITLMYMAFDLSYYQHLINKYRYLLIMYLILCTGVFIVLGKWLVRKNLQCLTYIADKTQKTSCSSLSDRLEIKKWPNEIIPVGMEFNKMIDRLESGFIRLSECAFELAHELRSPIHNLMGETEIILSKPRENEEYRYAHELNLDEYRRLALLVENVLFLARTDNPKTYIEMSEINCCSEVNIVSDYYNILAEEKNITIEKKGDGKLVANLILFRRALNNLLSNAVKYTPAGGKVVISIECNEKEAIVKVTDTGVGIPKDQLELVTTKFYRVNNACTNDKESLGFGLAIVKNIMELHQGKILIDSKVHHGTTITLSFPIR